MDTYFALLAAGSSSIKIQAGFDGDKLRQLQEDPSQPLYALKPFEDIGLYVTYVTRVCYTWGFGCGG